MQNPTLSVIPVRNKDGFGWKAVVQGRDDDHLMDWRGCNFVFLTIPGQPRKGFTYEAEADEFIRGLDDEVKEQLLANAAGRPGSWRPEVNGYDWREYVRRTGATTLTGMRRKDDPEPVVPEGLLNAAYVRGRYARAIIRV